GLERLCLVLQGRPTVYETDLFRPIISTVEQLTGLSYDGSVEDAGAAGSSAGTARRRAFGIRVLADHARSMTFLVGDGLEPSNEGRGYILRRIIRRAIRHGRMLGLERPFLKDLSASVIERMAGAYPNLSQDRLAIFNVIEAEEEKFNQTLSQGLSILNAMVSSLRHGQQLPGSDAFRLYDTYGFPLEVTQEILAERGLAVDETGFLAELEQQRARSRAALRTGPGLGTSPETYREVLRRTGPVEFLGYDTCEAEGHVVAILRQGEAV